MGSYGYYSDDANLFAFNGDANLASIDGQNVWFAQPQTMLTQNPDNFVFESNPYMVSAADDVSAFGLDKHYDNPVNISSWITTASPTGYPYHFENTLNHSGCSSSHVPPLQNAAAAIQSGPEAAFVPVVQDSRVGSFSSVGVANLNYGSPHPSSGVSYSTPYTRVISTSTSASSCPGSSSTLATPRFDPSTHFAPSQLTYDDNRYRKASWPNPVTPDTSDVFTTAPLVPPPIKQPVILRRPENVRLPGQSPPAVATPQQAMFDNMPRPAGGGRSLRSTPSIESLREFAEEQDASAPSSIPKPLLSPFSSLAPDSTSMSRTYSAPCSFLQNCTLETAPSASHSRQNSETWTSPFTSEPLQSSPNPNFTAKVVKRKVSAKGSLSASSMMRSATTSGLSTSPFWTESWSPSGHSPSGHLLLGAPSMMRSASTSSLTTSVVHAESSTFTPSCLEGWTSQVPLPNSRGVGLQASNANDTSCINTSTTIPALTVLPADGSSPFSSEPRNLTVPGTGTARPTKKLPKRAQAGPSAVKLTFMNLGPKDGEEITSAVAESGKSKRKRPEDSSSGDDTAKMKRSKSQNARPASA